MTFWVAGAAVVGAGVSYAASQKSADAGKQASKDNKQLAQQTLAQQNALAQQQLEISRPYVQSGQNALNAINSFLGLPSVRGSNFNGGTGGVGGMGGNPNLVLLPGITTNGVHSKQTTGGGLGGLLEHPVNFDKANLVSGIAAPMAGITQTATTSGGGAGNQIYYDRYNDALVDGSGNIFLADASKHSGDVAGAVSGFNNGVQLNNGTLFGVGSKGAGSLNLNLKPLTAEEKAAYDRGGAGPATDYNQNINNILNLPGFNYTRQAGNDVINKNLAQQGKFFSGQRGAALVNYNNNLTAQQIQSMYLDPLMREAGFGTTGAQLTGNALTNSQQNLGNYAGNAMGANIDAANARASGYAAAGNAINQGIGNYLLYNRGSSYGGNGNLLAQPNMMQAGGGWNYGGIMKGLGYQ